MTRARVVLLIPVHDDRRGLHASLQSIDEPMPVDVVVVDDGSPTPLDEEELRRAHGARGTLWLERLEPNRGVARARNHGLRRCLEFGHEMIGLLDAGDRNRPGRLAAQLAALDRGPHMGAVGAWAQVVSPEGRALYTIEVATSHEAIVGRLWWNMPMVHPSMVVRSDLLRAVGGYPEDLPAAEDYGMVAALAARTRLANLPIVLLDKEFDPASISTTQRRAQVLSRLRVIRSLDGPAWRRALGILRNLPLLAATRTSTLHVKRLVRGLRAMSRRWRRRLSPPGRGGGRPPSGRG